MSVKFLLFFLNSPPMTRDVTCSRLYLDGKNRRQYQMNFLFILHRIHVSPPEYVTILFYIFRIILNMVDLHISTSIVTIIVYQWFILLAMVIITNNNNNDNNNKGNLRKWLLLHMGLTHIPLALHCLFITEYHWLTIMTESQTEKIYNHETSLFMQNTGACTV